MAEMGIADNFTKMTAVYKEYVSGAAPIANQQAILDDIAWLKEKDLRFNHSFWYYSHQPCANLVLHLRYQSEEVYWGPEMAAKVGPVTDATDYGYCCFITPQIALKERPARGVLSRRLYHTAVAMGSKNGEENGLGLILDLENFNFAYHRESSQGLRVTVHDHRSKPIVGHESVLVAAGRETLISAMPVVSSTTEDAIQSLDPARRDCYTDEEAQLRFFEWEMGYFYNLNNCFLNYALFR